MRSLLLAATLFCSAAEAAPVPDFAHALAQMAAHKASYRLTLAGSPKGAVSAASGTMDYEVIDSCDGWATQQKLAMAVTNNDGQTVQMVSDYSTWEAKNGSKLRFRVRQTTDTAVTLQLSGQADFASGSGTGVVHYNEPKPNTVKLAVGTLFPMAHTAHIMALAQSGQKFINLPLFDGSSDSGAQDTFVVVTSSSPPAANPNPVLAQLPSDQVNVTFYDQGAGADSDQPDYTVAMRYWTNGVADDLKMDFGAFSMAGKITQFVPTPHPC